MLGTIAIYAIGHSIAKTFGTADTPSQGQTQESDIIGLPPIGAEHDRYALARSPTDASSVEGVSSFMIPPAGGIQSTAPITNQIGHDLHSPKTGLAATTNQILNHSNEFNPDLFFMPFDNIGFNTNFDWIFESSGIEECESDMFLNTANDQEDSPSQLLPISVPKTLTQSTTMPVVIDDSVEGGPLGGLLIPQPQDNSDHGDPWPLEVTRPPLKHIVLPPLVGRPQETSYSCGRYFNVTPINDQTWHALHRCIQLPFEHSTLQTVDLRNFPSKDELDHLIYHAKCMGLFRSEGNNHAPLGATKQEKWQNYIRAESSRRLGWAVFQYDSSVAYLHNNRPFLGLADLNFNLPGSREHWEAENADVWASFHPWSKSVPLTSPLRPKLASFFDGSPDPAGNLSEEHLLIISLMLLSMLWSIKEFRSFPLEDLARPLGFEDGRQAMMHAMDQIKVPILAMADSHTQSEMERLVDRTQLAHVAHIYGAGDLMNWLFPYLRNDAERDTVKTRMLRWANEDHRRTRETASLLKRHKTWGIAENLMKVILSLSKQDA
ncbi:unnamed protein product [Alternaria alternata]